MLTSHSNKGKNISQSKRLLLILYDAWSTQMWLKVRHHASSMNDLFSSSNNYDRNYSSKEMKKSTFEATKTSLKITSGLRLNNREGRQLRQKAKYHAIHLTGARSGSLQSVIFSTLVSASIQKLKHNTFTVLNSLISNFFVNTFNAETGSLYTPHHGQQYASTRNGHCLRIL